MGEIKNFPLHNTFLEKEQIKKSLMDLQKINHILQEEHLDDDLDYLYIASEKIGYTILVDQFKNTILNLTDAFSYALLRALLESEVSYTQYRNYASILTDERVVEKLNQLSGKTLFRYIQSLIAYIEPIGDVEMQTVYIIEEIEERIQHKDQKTLFALLCEKDSFTISELISALSEQIHNMNEFLPELYHEQNESMITKISYLENLPFNWKKEYLEIVKQILNCSIGLLQQLEQIRNITEHYYNRLKQSKVIAVDFSQKRGNR